MSKAAEILEAGAGHMKDRAQTYDSPQGERSMEACVRMFNALTGHDMTAEQGWHFMTCLKMVRSQQGGYRADNYEDGAAYFALAGEQAEQDRVPPAPEPEQEALEFRHSCSCVPGNDGSVYVWTNNKPVDFCDFCKKPAATKPSYPVQEPRFAARVPVTGNG